MRYGLCLCVGVCVWKHCWWICRHWLIARKLIFFLFYEMATVVFCSGLFVNQDGALQRIRAEPCDNCLGSRVDDVLGLSFFGFFLGRQICSQQDNKRTPVPESIPPSSHSHELLIGDSQEAKEATEGEMKRRMRALPPVLEEFQRTVLSVGGLCHYCSLPNVFVWINYCISVWPRLLDY